MTQDDINYGRSICVVGVAPIRPAKFVMFASARSEVHGSSRRAPSRCRQQLCEGVVLTAGLARALDAEADVPSRPADSDSLMFAEFGVPRASVPL